MHSFAQLKSILVLLAILLLASACANHRQSDITQTVERASQLEGSQPDSAMALYEKACRQFHKGSDDAETQAAARAHLRLGYMLIDRQHRYIDAFSNLRESSRLAASQSMHDVAAEADNNTAVLYSYYDDVPNTLRHVHSAMAQALKGKYFNTAVWAYENVVVETILESPVSQQDMATCTRLLSQIPDTSAYYLLSEAARATAVSWMKRDWGALLPAVTRWMKLAGPDRPDLECVAAVAALKIGNQAEAVRHLRSAYGASTWNPVRLYAARLLVDTYGAQGDTDSAYIWHRRVRQLEDSIYQGQKYGAVRDMFTLVEAKEHNERMEQQKARAQMLAFWLGSAIVVCLLAAGAAIVIATQNRKLRRQARVLFRKDTELLNIRKEPETKPEAEADNRQLEELMDRIRQVMDNDKTICNPDFSISALAYECGKPIERVRNAIRICNKTNFSVMLSDARIRVASLRLRNPDFSHFTIEAIAQGVGIQSRSNFAVLFRRYTGINPAEYRKMASQECKQARNE